MAGRCQVNPELNGVWTVMAIVCALAALLAVTAADVAHAQSNPIPPEIRDLKMGSSTEAVIAKIKSVGSYTREEIKKENRSMLIWKRPDTPYYKDIEFQFTEKDRLYLIRFTLSDAARADYHSMKRTVFKDYDFSWERPQKHILPTREMLLYGPEKGMELFYIEFTDKKTHEKSFELFDRSISSTDRPEPLAAKLYRLEQEKKAKKKQTDGNTPEPGANVKEGDKSGAVPTPAEKVESPKSTTEKKSESTQPAPVPGETAKPTTEEKTEVPKPAAAETKVEKPAEKPVSTEKAEAPKAEKPDQKPVSK